MIAGVENKIQGPSALKPREFDQIRKLAYDQFGLELRAGKEQLVYARLAKIIRSLHFGSFQEYYDYLVQDRSGEALTAMIDALTTNHTSFFREPAHFTFLNETVLPRLRKRDRISIWSAACSSGEEPYSIAFSLMQYLTEGESAGIRILATDISTRVLNHAKEGVYSADRFNNLQLTQLRPYLLKGEDKWRGYFRVRKDIRDSIEFRRLNLMHNFSGLGLFPVIFCRNVMIYFDKSTQQDLVCRMSDCLEPGGFLLIGHAESLNRIDHGLRYVQPAVYQKVESGRSASKRAR